MASCSHVLDCPLFSVFTMHSALAIWKTNYCEGDFERCARLQLSSAGQPVPQTLLPNGKLLHLAFPPAGRP